MLSMRIYSAEPGILFKPCISADNSHRYDLLDLGFSAAYSYDRMLFSPAAGFIHVITGDSLVDISDKRTVLTRKGYEDIRRELDEILTVKRPAVVQRIKEARELGDLSENFDYQDAKQTQGLLEARIRDLKAIINSATIIDCHEQDGCVGIGSKVVLKDLEDGCEDEYTIVGPAESDPSEGKISHESCVGKVLMGCKAGDKVKVDTPVGATIEYEIISVG